MQTNKLTNIEKSLITESGSDKPFSVLLTTNETDSIFLRQKSQDITIEEISSSEVQQLINRMEVTLIEEEGVGLAAPQVGIQRNIFLFMRLDKKDAPVEAVINPIVVSKSPELINFEGDGCLSIPDERGTTSRHAWIDVKYYDSKGSLIEERLHAGKRGEDFTGVIFQHEFDHLNGILFIDRLVNDSVK